MGHTHVHTPLDEMTAAALDTSIPDSELSPAAMTRRRLLRPPGCSVAPRRSGSRRNSPPLQDRALR